MSSSGSLQSSAQSLFQRVQGFNNSPAVAAQTAANGREPALPPQGATPSIASAPLNAYSDRTQSPGTADSQDQKQQSNNPSANPSARFPQQNNRDSVSPNLSSPAQNPNSQSSAESVASSAIQNQNQSTANTLGDGQLSQEEIDELRQNGQLPPNFSPASPLEESALLPGMYKPVKEEVLLEWQAPSRPFRKPKRSFFANLVVIGVLIGLILLFANQFMPMAMVFAVVFLVYVLYSIPPGISTNAITTFGIRMEKSLYYWEEMGRFWITKSKGQQVLNVEIGRYPFQIHPLLGEIPPDVMTMILSEVLINQEPPPTPVDKMANWLKAKIPLDLED